MEELNKFKFLFDISAAGVPNLAYVETVDDEKVMSLFLHDFFWKIRKIYFPCLFKLMSAKLQIRM